MKVVVDTNVLISGAIGKGETINSLFDILFREHRIFTCKEMMNEIDEKLQSPKLKRFYDADKGRAFVDKFRKQALIVTLKFIVEVCRDPDDDKIISLAKTVQANYIISGDTDLLVLNPFENTLIVTPATFLKEHL